ncbi:MAG: DUF3108 domain-containing protein [Candidatus Accumulibacter propinquus]|jgi:hypothetical protein
MPVVLIIAFAASLGLHALALLAPDIDLSVGGEPPVLVAELKAPPKVLPAPVAKSEETVVPRHSRTVRRKALASKQSPQLLARSTSPLPQPESVPDPAPAPASKTASEPDGEQELTPQIPAAAPAPAASRWPARGMIRYRVDRGDQGFEIGFSIHRWEVIDGAYRLTAVTETNGLVALFRPLRFEVESRGRLTAAGLLPEHVITRQEGRETGTTADFDWDKMELRVANRPARALLPGTQDVLSFAYQLGLISDLAAHSSLPIATGKAYANYRIEIVGDEEIETPAGTFRCLHLRVPGVATTELWLAYDRALLPVKVQHIDRKGALFVQLAVTIEVSQEP